jgi:hypothetical protein
MMKTRVLRTVGILLAIAFTWSVIRLSAVTYRSPGVEQGVLRLAWRISAQGEEVCRPTTPEELAQIPVHMRRDTTCERPAAVWELVISLNDQVVERRDLEGAGARKDRPISLLEEWPLEPGEYDLDVLFRRKGAHEGDEDWRRLSETITVAPGGVHLVWIHPETGRMMLSH